MNPSTSCAAFRKALCSCCSGVLSIGSIHAWTRVQDTESYLMLR